MNLPPVEAIDTIYRFALQQPSWRRLPQCWRIPLLQYIPFPRVAEVRGCCRISLQQRPSSRLLALGRRPSLAFLVRREPSTANTLCLVHHDCAHNQATHVRDDTPLPKRSDGAAHCRSTTCDVATACARRGHGATVHVPLPTGPLASLLATSPPAAAATVSAGQLYPRPPSMPPLLGHLPPPR